MYGDDIYVNLTDTVVKIKIYMHIIEIKYFTYYLKKKDK